MIFEKRYNITFWSEERLQIKTRQTVYKHAIEDFESYRYQSAMKLFDYGKIYNYVDHEYWHGYDTQCRDHLSGYIPAYLEGKIRFVSLDEHDVDEEYG
ncbi:hypothetical protein [Dubosiella newyorkensis]|uniref:hypothetical protein n=1 Tax=Dubosiella newyorkensis TaxID=1862672 RepID=UPI003F661EA9